MWKWQFLTETYISIRRLENEAIKLIKGENIILDVEESNIQVHLNQFYGIEINDFAVSVAKQLYGLQNIK